MFKVSREHSEEMKEILSNNIVGKMYLSVDRIACQKKIAQTAVHIGPSKMPKAGNGCFVNSNFKKGIPLGIYVGKITNMSVRDDYSTDIRHSKDELPMSGQTPTAIAYTHHLSYMNEWIWSRDPEHAKTVNNCHFVHAGLGQVVASRNLKKEKNVTYTIGQNMTGM